ncbi:Plasmid encoded RepA protein (plasmid) [Corynebacterium mustelae]|uniref:Plasmid encoded RepA protein n=1 Tax=Corynebacterium mustelae TaxID=571915 RepID=A0A0G3H3T3_9CORY|nr:replication protein RepA [Corynebacterium mustelae]AKK07410.1 Plasmid encoded RepA protein [Corynebacterium mustelae]
MSNDNKFSPQPANTPIATTDTEIGYTSNLFVQALFPYKKSTDTIRAVHNGPNTITVLSINGVPYGKYPRLIMAYIITQAVENAGKVRHGLMTEEEARRIPLGHSMNGFLEKIGITTRGTGGSKGTLTILREQMLRIASSVITVQRRTENRTLGKNSPIIDQWDLWFDPGNPDQVALEESYIMLTKEFYERIKNAPIPIDLNIFRELGKPRAMDLYVWLTLKKYWLHNRPETQYQFTWSDMAANFATKKLTTTQDLAHFRQEIKKSIATILTHWPDAGITADTTGVTIHAGQPSITIKPPHQLP